MLLNEILRGNYHNKSSKRRGRGDGSGRGNYSGRGDGGQNSRSGSKMRPGFEGGQTPINKRIPKFKGFKRPRKLIINSQTVNLGLIDEDNRIQDGETIDKNRLKELNYISKLSLTVKVLGGGDFSKKLSFSGLDYYSSSAKEKIEKAGGNIE